MKYAYFAGGCFWCMISPFDILEGIINVRSGYMGGDLENPNYEDVKSQNSGHYEVIQVEYDPTVIKYEKLLQGFWRQIDPTDSDGQFRDRGPSYKTAIFVIDEEQELIAKKSLSEMEHSNRFPKKIVTEIIKASKYYDAEEYHQDFYKKNPEEYSIDRTKSGRDEFIKKYWGEDYYSIYED